MTDFNYMQKAVDLDRRLEAIMESHVPAKVATEGSGLQSFMERGTIAEEIAGLQKQAVNLNHAAAAEMLDKLAAEKEPCFDDFLEMAKAASAEYLEAAAEQAEINAHLEMLRAR